MDALCLNQRYVERPKPTREPQLPGVGSFSSGLLFLNNLAGVISLG